MNLGSRGLITSVDIARTTDDERDHEAARAWVAYAREKKAEPALTITGVEMIKTATPNNGFVVIDAILLSGALVQCAVAVKNVSAAGIYDVTLIAMQ